MDRNEQNYGEWMKKVCRIREEDCIPELRRRRMDEKVMARIFEIRENQSRHNSYDQEIREQQAIEKGDPGALEMSIMEEYIGDIGMLDEQDTLRNIICLTVVVITLASRSAIRGGLSPELAFAVSDIYINEINRCTSPEAVARLCRGAEYRFARMVSGLKNPGPLSEDGAQSVSRTEDEAERGMKTEDGRTDDRVWEKDLTAFGEIMRQEQARRREESRENEHVSRAKDYIFRHLHDRIRTEEVAGALALNPRYLSTLFHRETGLTISQYIRREKIRLVRNMLTYSDYTYLEIAHYLGFSSQSHRGDLFRRETGMTLGEYRRKYQRKEK